MVRAMRVQQRHSMFSEMPRGIGDTCTGPTVMRQVLQEPQALLLGWRETRWGSREPRMAPDPLI